jgi:hypothetical protein
VHGATARGGAILAGALLLAGGCARASHIGTDLGPIAGSAERLQPHIASASGMSGPRLVISFTIPQRSYVNVVRVRTQNAVSLLGASPAGAPAVERLDAGDHKLVLTDLPVYVNADRNRMTRPDDGSDPRLRPTDTRYPIHGFVVLIATEKPMSLVDLRESLADVDLNGPDDAVLARVAEAIGSHSLGAWAASAVRPDGSSAPF